MGKKLTMEHCHVVAKERGFKCLSKEYINAATKMEWQCENGHMFCSTLQMVKNRKRRCPRCPKHVGKHTIEDCKKLAAKHNGQCLSTVYKDNKASLEWECETGHKWLASYHHVDVGNWCFECNGSKKKTIQECCDFAKKMGGECLSTVYLKNNCKLLWRCEKGHEWSMIWNSVQQGQWCPSCRIPKSQTKLAEIIEKIFGFTTLKNCKDFKWLKTRNKKKMEIDIYVKELKIAIEYDGEQHFKPMRRGTKEEMEKELKIIKWRDRTKNRKVKKHIKDGGEDIKHFIRFNYKEELTEEYVRQKLIKHGILKG